MSVQQNLVKKLQEFLKPSAIFSSVPLSLLLIGLEAMMDRLFTCPCRSDLNALITASIFTGPALFTFALMFYQLRPLTHGWFHCPQEANDDTPQSCFKVLASCLIPPVMWIFILLIDGDYVACSKTDWKGIYVLDRELNWCKPTEEKQNENEQQDLTRKFIHQSRFAGYVVISVFSALAIVFMGIYDSCISGKCNCCPKRLLTFCGRTDSETCDGRNDPGQDEVELDTRHATSSSTEDPHV
ncbi:uncharacterized protein LOC131529768 [Onychostoma macrolepis]|uniref:uncharacterized protein LOC131529768 n=1 Tax=Onychostoma macrolepis TaxID=369639 RepID=UPI00272BEEE4|nr:uncharacterized protein LOC131529768 [Onychostoma macrolepis]